MISNSGIYRTTNERWLDEYSNEEPSNRNKLDTNRGKNANGRGLHFIMVSRGSKMWLTLFTTSEPVSLKRSWPFINQQDSTLGSAWISFIFLNVAADRSS